jgi:DNA-binding LacI/PurR family transcriptional regulator
MKTDNKFIYEKIQDYLDTMISRGKVKIGDRIISQRDLARKFNTSHIPVRQAMHRLIEQGILEKHPGRGTFVKRVRNASTNQLAVLYHFQDDELWGSSFYAGVFSGINIKAQQEERMLVLRSLWLERGRQPSDAFGELRDRVDGFLFIGPSREILEQARPFLRDLGKPVVVLDYEGELEAIDQVCFDGYANMYRMTEFVIGLGHRQVAFASTKSPVYDNLTNPNFIHRRTAWQDCLRAHGLPPGQELILGDGDRTFSDLMARADRPTAIICAGDGIALQVCALAREMGITVPDDLTVTGYDNVPAGETARPALTTIANPVKEMGRRGVEIILAAQQDPERIPARLVLPGTLVKRESHAQLRG